MAESAGAWGGFLLYGVLVPVVVSYLLVDPGLAAPSVLL